MILHTNASNCAILFLRSQMLLVGKNPLPTELFYLEEYLIAQIENVSSKEILLNINKYLDLFLADGVIHFKKLFATTKEQWDITCAIGEHFGFLPNLTLKEEMRPPFYCVENEDHKNTFNRHLSGPTNISRKKSIFIEWHMENIHQDNPQIAASWNMIKFKCDPSSGTTGFVNMAKIFSIIPEEWISFLKKIKIKSTTHTDNTGTILFLDDHSSGTERPIIQKHYKTNVPVVRMGFYPNENLLSSVDGLDPSEEDIFLFKQIEGYISEEVLNNSDIQHWISWDEGDLVLVDLFTMAHAVRGGFSLGERIFSRVWCYQQEPFN